MILEMPAVDSLSVLKLMKRSLIFGKDSTHITHVCATRDPRLFAAVPLWNENHSILNDPFRTAAPAHGAMLAQA
jgi:hypothetical protein